MVGAPVRGAATAKLASLGFGDAGRHTCAAMVLFMWPDDLRGWCGTAGELMNALKGSSIHLISPEMAGKDVMTLFLSHIISALEALGCSQMPCTGAAGALQALDNTPQLTDVP